jgi:hypothetical protein
MKSRLSAYMRNRYTDKFIKSTLSIPKTSIHISTFVYNNVYVKFYIHDNVVYRVCQYGSYTEIAIVELL